MFPTKKGDHTQLERIAYDIVGKAVMTFDWFATEYLVVAQLSAAVLVEDQVDEIVSLGVEV